MVIELKSEQLRVEFNSFGWGLFLLLKDAEGLSICGKEMLLIEWTSPVLPHLWFIREDTALYIDDKGHRK